METVATVLYARLRNVLPICKGLSPDRSAELASELRSVLQDPIAKHNGVVAQMRPDSVLAVFANGPETKPDHARRALHAALLTVYQTAGLRERIAEWTEDVAGAPLGVAAGVHIGKVEVTPARSGNSGAVRISDPFPPEMPRCWWTAVCWNGMRRCACTCRTSSCSTRRPAHT